MLVRSRLRSCRRGAPPARQAMNRRDAPRGRPPVIRLQGRLSRGGRVLLDRADANIGRASAHRAGRPEQDRKTTCSRRWRASSRTPGDIVQPWRDVIRLEQGLPSSALPAWRSSRPRRAPRAGAARSTGRARRRRHRARARATTGRRRAGSLPGAQPQPARRLGFDAAQAEQPVDALSGGWRMRLNRASAVCARRPAAARRADQPPD